MNYDNLVYVAFLEGNNFDKDDMISYGWADASDMRSGTVIVLKEDPFGGCTEVKVSAHRVFRQRVQKQGPLGKACEGEYLNSAGEVIGYYKWSKEEGLLIDVVEVSLDFGTLPYDTEITGLYIPQEGTVIHKLGSETINHRTNDKEKDVLPTVSDMNLFGLNSVEEDHISFVREQILNFEELDYDKILYIEDVHGNVYRRPDYGMNPVPLEDSEDMGLHVCFQGPEYATNSKSKVLRTNEVASIGYGYENSYLNEKEVNDFTLYTKYAKTIAGLMDKSMVGYDRSLLVEDFIDKYSKE
jgi:hypothetical protein